MGECAGFPDELFPMATPGVQSRFLRALTISSDPRSLVRTKRKDPRSAIAQRQVHRRLRVVELAARAELARFRLDVERAIRLQFAMIGLIGHRRGHVCRMGELPLLIRPISTRVFQQRASPVPCAYLCTCP